MGPPRNYNSFDYNVAGCVSAGTGAVLQLKSARGRPGDLGRGRARRGHERARADPAHEHGGLRGLSV